jgi:group I intron endonuclease
MENSGIYLIKNKINDKVYIGSSINFKNRWYKHKSGKGSIHLFNSILKYGLENFEFKILENFDISKNRKLLYDKEQKWMDFYNISKYNSYNIRFKATPNMTTKRDESFKEKMREIRLKLSIGSKPIIQYTLDGNFIKHWSSSSEVERTLNLRARNISGACKGEQHTAFGFIWKYENEPLEDSFIEQIKNRRPKIKCVIQKSLTGEIINFFNSMKDASKKTGYNYSRLGIACNKGVKYNGFYWEFTKSPTFS